jgi:DNA-binding Lrp family transcriptional regulator
MDSVTIDLLDQQLIQALHLDGRVSFARLAEVLGSSEHTMARRYRRLRELGGLQVVVRQDTRRLGWTSWWLRLRCTPDSAAGIAEALARHPDISFINLISGGTEIACSVHTRTSGDRDALLLHKLPRTPRVLSITAQSIVHPFYAGSLGWYSKAGRLSDEQYAALLPPAPGGDGPVGLDEHDEALLAVLGQDGRARYAELAAATGLSEATVRRRVEHLLGTGAAYVDVQFGPGLVGHQTTVVMWLTVAPSALESVGRALAGHRQVAFAAATTGPSNVLATVLCEDSEAFYRYLSQEVGALPGVLQAETAPVVRQVKQLVVPQSP